MDSAALPETASGPASILLLAVIQGLAEFLPVSSSGHLVVARAAMDVHEAGLALDVALHVGTLLAVVWAYRADLARTLLGLRDGGLRLLAWLALATVPIGIVGLTARHALEEAFQSPTVAGVGLLCTTLALFAGETARRRRARLPAPRGPLPRPPFVDALVLGLAQALAIVPGISRSGSTIAAGLLRGYSGAEAARLSFLMSIPAVIGAAAVSLPDAVEEGFGGLSPGLVWGAVGLSALVGWGALRGLLLTLGRGAFLWFAAYCAALGTAVLVFL